MFSVSNSVYLLLNYCRYTYNDNKMQEFKTKCLLVRVYIL